MSVVASKRQNMVHFQDMRPEEFVGFIQHVAKHLKGKLSNLKTVMKIDGLGARFGKDSSGRIFFEGSRTGPIFDDGAFSAYARANSTRADVIARASHYDDLLSEIKSSRAAKSLPPDTKVVCEIFYNPLATEDDDGITFVTVKYDKTRLGSLMTIMPYEVLVASTGEKHPDSDKILKNLYAVSDSRIRVIDPQLKMGTIELTGFIDPIVNLDDAALRKMKSRKAADRAEREALLQIVNNTKEALADYLLKHPEITDKFKLGPNIEGIVVHINGKPYKITTPEFKQAIKAKKMLNESFNAADMLPRGTKECELFLGRMQPIHNGHLKIIKSMKNGVVALVKGAKSSTDTKRNPLDAEYQLKLIKAVAPEVRTIVVPTGYIPEIINILRNERLEVTTVYAGADRIASYKAQIDRVNKMLDAEHRIVVTFKETERVTSASAVREAIRSGDRKRFQQLVPKAIWGEFNTLQSYLKETKMIGFEEIKSFEQFLNEKLLKEEEGTAAGGEGSEGNEGEADEKQSNSSEGVARKDQPLRRKKENGDWDEKTKEKLEEAIAKATVGIKSSGQEKGATLPRPPETNPTGQATGKESSAGGTKDVVEILPCDKTMPGKASVASNRDDQDDPESLPDEHRHDGSASQAKVGSRDEE